MLRRQARGGVKGSRGGLSHPETPGDSRGEVEGGGVSFTGYFRGFPLSRQSWGAAPRCHSAAWPCKSRSGCCGSLLLGPEGGSCRGKSEGGVGKRTR